MPENQKQNEGFDKVEDESNPFSLTDEDIASIQAREKEWHEKVVMLIDVEELIARNAEQLTKAIEREMFKCICDKPDGFVDRLFASYAHPDCIDKPVCSEKPKDTLF